jgi:hypothetical protein
MAVAVGAWTTSGVGLGWGRRCMGGEPSRTLFLIPSLKGQPGVNSSYLHSVRGRVQLLWVSCTQHFPAFLQKTICRT